MPKGGTPYKIVDVNDPTSGVETITYNFQKVYGFTPQGQQFFNAITEAQKQRTREALELWSRYLGVQLLCFGTPDAEGERQRLDARGFIAQPMLNLERKVGKRTARFEVVRAEPAKMPEGRIQFVRQLTPELLWRKPDVNDLGLSSVFVVAEDPPQVAARWAAFASLLPRPLEDRIVLETERGRVEIAQRNVLRELLGEAPPAPALAGYALKCKDPKAFLARCSKASLDVRGSAVVLPPALGGAWLIQ